MATVFRGLLNPVWQPLKTCIRLRTRINIQKPRPPHFTRAKVEELCKPRYPRKIDPAVPLYELCSGPGINLKEPENPYEILLSKQALSLFRTHKYIFFFHYNSMRREEDLEMQVKLKNCGVFLRKYGRKTLQHKFIGTMYEPVLALFHSHTVIGFGNDVKLAEMIGVLRKTKICLLAGIIDDRLLSVTELSYYSTLPSINILRASLVSLLNSTAGNIVKYLNHHPSTLVRHLENIKETRESKT